MKKLNNFEPANISPNTFIQHNRQFYPRIADGDWGQIEKLFYKNLYKWEGGKPLGFYTKSLLNTLMQEAIDTHIDTAINSVLND